MLDETGRYLEQGDWEGLLNAARANPEIARNIEGMTTYLPGSKVPDYTLVRPKGLAIMNESTTVDGPKRLSELLAPNTGHVNWAACTEFFSTLPRWAQ